MPEGDTIFKTARALNAALAGDEVARFESVFPALTRVDRDRPLAGRAIESVVSRGKHLLMFFSGDLILHTHMRMNGVWQVYRTGERWRRPARDMRVLVATSRAVAVGFAIPVAQLLTARELERHRDLQQLGPDLLGQDFDRDEVVRRMRERGTESIADALLNQRIAAGIGNVFKSEILFVAGVNPFAEVKTLDDIAIHRLLDVARKLLRSNVVARPLGPAAAPGRRTTNSLHPRKGLWVYERAGDACRKCGASIRFRKTGLDARGTYWCPRCQPEPVESS